MPRNIIIGRHVHAVKTQRARELRQKMTPAETRLWAALRNKQLGGLRFRRQQVIDGFIVDFYCHSAALIIEVDGPIHAAQPHYDAARAEVLTQHGLTILRLTNDEVLEHLDQTLTRILTACQKT